MTINNYSVFRSVFNFVKLKNRTNSTIHKLNAFVKSVDNLITDASLEFCDQLSKASVTIKKAAHEILLYPATNLNKLVSNLIHSLEDKNRTDEGAPQSEPTNRPTPLVTINNSAGLAPYSAREQDLLRLIYRNCADTCSLKSSPMKTTEIVDELGLANQSVRNLIASIVKKNGITVQNVRQGSGHFRIFEMSSSLYRCLADDSLNPVKLPLKKPASSNLIHRANVSNCANSSSYIYNSKKKEEVYISTQNRARASLYAKNVTVKVMDRAANDHWAMINITPLRDIGFTSKQLEQLKPFQKPDELQQSILHFAFALEHGDAKKKYQNPLNVFMGVMRKGQSWIEINYLSPEELQMKIQLAEQEAAERLRERQINEFAQRDFNAWEANLDAAEKEKLIPATIAALPFKSAAVSFLRTFYRDYVLPQRMQNGEIQYAS